MIWKGLAVKGSSFRSIWKLCSPFWKWLLITVRFVWISDINPTKFYATFKIYNKNKRFWYAFWKHCSKRWPLNDDQWSNFNRRPFLTSLTFKFVNIDLSCCFHRRLLERCLRIRFKIKCLTAPKIGVNNCISNQFYE